MHRFLILSLLLPVVGSANDTETIIRKALPYLETNGVKWMQKRKCVSCHQITSMLWGVNETARTKIGFDRKKLEEWRNWAEKKTAALEKDPEKKPPVDNMAKLMIGNYSAKAYPQFAQWITKQSTNGHWKAGGQLPRQKRPARETDEVSTMWAMRALAPLAKKDKEISGHIRSARAWVAKGKPGVSTEWWVVRTLTSKGKKRDELLRKLVDLQNDNGGWGWIAGKQSDALATGLALYGLSEGDDAKSVERARKFLRSTQRKDGSWDVPSTKKSNKGESGPVSNYWGTAWAVVGLAATLGD